MVLGLVVYKQAINFTVYYIKGFSEKRCRIKGKFGIRSVFKSENTLKRKLTYLKPKQMATLKEKMLLIKFPVHVDRTIMDKHLGQSIKIF